MMPPSSERPAAMPSHVRPPRLARVLPLALLLVAAAASGASAQTLMVRGAPAGSTIELAVNTEAAGTATVNQAGEATIPVPLPAGRPQIDALVFLDVCGERRRFVIVERGQPALIPEAGCERTQIQGLYLVRRPTVMLVTLSSGPASLMLLQRPLGSGPSGWSPATTGLSLFGGGGIAKFSDHRVVSCGNVGNCSGGGYTPAFTVGADLWLLRFAGVEAAYSQVSDARVTGSGTGHRFTADMNARLFTASGKLGIPIGPVRLYGRVGANYHRAEMETVQTIDDRTVTVNNQSVTIPGGTQTNHHETKGWSYAFGGGMEMWFKSWLAAYADVGRTALKGEQVGGGEAIIDDMKTSFVFGARFRIGG